jgi:23S rRNA (adenine2503-C2)-methyltransferase
MQFEASYEAQDGTLKYRFSVNKKGLWSGLGLRSSIESAFIHLPGRSEDKPEHILCLSSQIGCVYSCLQCANMFTSFDGCLSSEEINEQISLVLGEDGNLSKIRKAKRVEHAFMAIGEPLYGYGVIRAIQKHKPYVEDTRFALSTIGAIGSVDKLTRADLPFPTRLELSLHHSNDKMRREFLIPRYEYFRNGPVLQIKGMFEEAERYVQKTQCKVTLNYALIDGVNNGDANISELQNLLRGKENIFYVKVMYPNLTSSHVYSYRGVESSYGFEQKSTKFYNPDQFRKELESAGISATAFKSLGIDIGAGCGMMSNRFGNITGRRGRIDFTIPQADPAKLGFI